MNKNEFKKILMKVLTSYDFKKDGNKFVRHNDEIAVCIEIQKSNYDQSSYYINFGFVILESEIIPNLKHVFYDLFGRFSFTVNDKEETLIDITKLDHEKLIKEFNDQIEAKIMFILQHGLKEFIKEYPEYIPVVTTLKARKYLGFDK